jgi:hypothetical protein
MRALLTLILSCGILLAADDWVVGEFDKLDQLHIELDEEGFMVRIQGPPEVLAQFVECYFDNISDQYRLQPKYRKIVEREMNKAREKGKVSIALYRDNSYNAFGETTGWRY